MTEWEKAIAHWLPEVWTPGKKCQGGFRMVVSTVPPLDGVRKQCPHGFMAEHTIPCPPPSRDLGFRLLEAIAAKGYQYNVINYFNKEKEVRCILYGRDQNFLWSPLTSGSDPDLLTAITKAAATLAEKERS